ncbi:MAG: DapH/DapD/GlmU-related protein [Candidatus Bruticola sp.]
MVVKNLEELADFLGGRLNIPESASLTIKEVTGLDAASCHNLDSAITFAENENVLQEAVRLGFAAVIIPEKIQTDTPAILVKNARVAYAQLLDLYYPPVHFQPGIHKTSYVSSSANIAPTAYIGPFAVIEDGVTVGDRCQIQAHVSIGSGSFIGADTRLMPGVSLGKNVKLSGSSLVGPLTVIDDEASLASDIEIGARCFIGSKTNIGQGVRIDNLACINREVVVEPLAIIISQNCLQERVHIGKLSIAAGQCLIKEGCRVGNCATVAARSGVDKDIPAGQSVWSGDPAEAHKMSMRRIAMHQLPVKNWEQIKKLAKLSPKDRETNHE